MDQSTQSTEQAHQIAGMMAAYGLFIGLFFLILFLFQLVIMWRIASKAGYSGVMSLLMLVPLVNFIVILLFAFMEWPVEKRAKMAGGMMPPPGMMPPGTQIITQ